MTVIVGLSAKGSPGVSLGMWGLVQCWPRPVIGMETDTAGGTWALRHGLTSEPGLASLAAAQGSLDGDLVRAHSIAVGEERFVVCAPIEGTVVRAAMGWLGDRLLAWPSDGDLLIDAGRVASTTVRESAVLKRADTVLAFTRPCAEELGPLAHLLSELGPVLRESATVVLVLIGSGPYGATETLEAVRELTGHRLAIGIGAVLPDDPGSAAQIRDGGRRAAKVASRWFGPLANELAAASAHRAAMTAMPGSNTRRVEA